VNIEGRLRKHIKVVNTLKESYDLEILLRVIISHLTYDSIDYDEKIIIFLNKRLLYFEEIYDICEKDNENICFFFSYFKQYKYLNISIVRFKNNEQLYYINGPIAAHSRIRSEALLINEK